ncbi:hypothetical protein EBB07_23130 [Paenibacillaceae bacterium]|nr:hypothetical protein EBB07_23130 [Paenibacillaceae bacterium]
MEDTRLLRTSQYARHSREHLSIDHQQYTNIVNEKALFKNGDSNNPVGLRYESVECIVAYTIDATL